MHTSPRLDNSNVLKASFVRPRRRRVSNYTPEYIFHNVFGTGGKLAKRQEEGIINLDIGSMKPESEIRTSEAIPRQNSISISTGSLVFEDSGFCCRCEPASAFVTPSKESNRSRAEDENTKDIVTAGVLGRATDNSDPVSRYISTSSSIRSPMEEATPSSRQFKRPPSLKKGK